MCQGKHESCPWLRAWVVVEYGSAYMRRDQAMQEIRIRPEKQSDADAISVVNRSAFGGEEEAQLVMAIRASSSFVPDLSLVAEVGDRIAGPILLFPIQLDRPGGSSGQVLALAPMAVVPSQSLRDSGALRGRAAGARAAGRGGRAGGV